MINDDGVIARFKKLDTVPKYFFQSPIFPASIMSRKLHAKSKLIETYSGQEIEVTHPGFNQIDLAVSIAFKKIITNCKRFDSIDFTIREFSKCLGRADGGKTRKLILDAFERSNHFSLAFDFGEGKVFDGQRLKKFEEISAGVFFNRLQYGLYVSIIW